MLMFFRKITNLDIFYELKKKKQNAIKRESLLFYFLEELRFNDAGIFIVIVEAKSSC